MPIRPVAPLLTLIANLAIAAPPATLDLAFGHSLVPRSSFTDALGQRHTRLRHFYRGLPVWASEAILHGGAGATDLPATPRLEVDFTPALAPAEAERRVREHLGQTGADARLTTLESVLVPRSAAFPLRPAPGLRTNAAQVFHAPPRYALAYRIRAEAGRRWDYLLDAGDRRVLGREPLDLGDVPARGRGRTLYSGEVSLDSSAGATGFRLIDHTRGQGGPFDGNAVTNLGHQALAELGDPCASSDNTWGDGQAEIGAAAGARALTVAADAAWGVQCSWDYFGRIHQRRGWDGQGSALTTRIHFLDPSLAEGGQDNAAWNSDSSTITVADGEAYWPHSSLFVMAHEFAHGVTVSSAGLGYQGEAGGLNEASSDIFAAMVTAFAANGAGNAIGGGGQWQFTKVAPGDDGPVTEVGRDMAQPSHAGAPDVWSPALAELDPHLASGPMNRAFYFLSQGAAAGASALLPAGMAGLGNDQAAAIWYRALTTYLKPDSGYLDARKAALRAARDLFGAGSAQNVAVRRAFGAINVGSADATQDDFQPPTVSLDASSSGASLVLLAQASDDSEVAGIQCFVDGLPLVQGRGNRLLASLDLGRLLANGGHSLVAKALDTSGNEGSSETLAFTLAGPYQQLLQDPGLELPAGDSPWQGQVASLSHQDQEGQDPPHGGSRCFLFDGEAPWSVGQGVSLPAQAASATLRFWLKVSGPTQAPVQSSLRVLADPGVPGQAPVQLAAFSNQDAWPDWLERTLDLSRFLGQRLTLTWAVDPADPGTQFRLDDITVVAGAAPVAVAVSPARLALLPGAGGALSATVTGSDNPAVLWSVRESGGGSVDPYGRYSAPARPGVYHAVATAAANPNAAAEVSIQVLPRVNVQPQAATLECGASLALELALAPGVEVDLTLAAGAGSARRQGASVVYTAPATPGSYLLVLSERADPASRATVSLTVVAPLRLSLEPASAVLAAGGTLRFTAKVDGAVSGEVDWAVLETGGGTLHSDVSDLDRFTRGVQVYTAPAVPGSYTLQVTSRADPARRAQAAVLVKSTDLDGDGVSAGDFGDLALFADAYGTVTAPGQGVPADLNGDGRVDDLDLALAKAGFEAGAALAVRSQP